MAVRPRIIRPPARLGGSDDAVQDDGIDATAEAVDPDFDENTYLRAFPDIAEAVRRGVLPSGLAHYRQSGRAEGRLEKPEYRALLGVEARPAAPPVAIDTLTVSPSGSILMTGWADDRFDPLSGIMSRISPGVAYDWVVFPRLVRPDVERTLDAFGGHRFGFLLVAAPAGDAEVSVDGETAAEPVFRFASGLEATPRRDPVVASDGDLRDLALAALSTAVAAETDELAMFRLLDQNVGAQLVGINRLIAERAGTRRLVEHFGPRRQHYRASVITVMRGGADQIVPRLALTATGPGADAFEFILVVTGPHQFEPALRAARIAEMSLGVALTIVLQADGDPTSIGDDVAHDCARSDHLIFMDQSTFPRIPDWALRHTALLDDAPAEQTRVMGAPLFRADGTLCHAGYYFKQETSVLARENEAPVRVTAIEPKSMTHPLPSAAVDGSRPAVAVAAAFLSIDRGWLETLGGISHQYCHAVHEDIDLCLRSLKRGVPAWVHPLPMWYFDRRPPLRAEPPKGAAILNDWLLHRQWDEMIVPDLLGPSPRLLHPMPLTA